MRRLPFGLLLPVLVALSAAPVSAAQFVAPERAAAPELRVSGGGANSLELEFAVGDVARGWVDVAGERFAVLELPGGGLAGTPGRAGLPTFTRLVALPAGMTATLGAVDDEPRSLDCGRVLPLQPDGAERFVMDRDWYATGRAEARALATLGEAATMGGLRVVPLTLSPIGYDPASGRVEVAERMRIAIDFAPDPSAPAPAPPARTPESFDRLYRDLIVNYEAGAEPRSGESGVGPGTWLLISDSDSGVPERLQPLIDWRRRCGYNVIYATTAETGTQDTLIKSYIQGVYDTVDPPLEFVTLAGDATGGYTVDCWNENLSWFHGEGDHYYTLLEGDDLLADVHIGRLSFRSLAELETIVDKILAYETNPPLGDPGWFTRAGLCGDPFNDTGISAIYANQWLKSQLLAAGYTQVDTIWSGNFPLLMAQSINQGLSVFGYRGIGGMSGMSASAIQNLQNGGELPFAVIVTCDTGSFQDDYTCRSEAFLKAPNGGGIGAIGTATIGTHTRYNETFYYGCWAGAINGTDHRLGTSHTRGKLELYLQYHLFQLSNVEIWSVWNNLMGDPATDLYTAQPQALDVGYPGQLPPGAGALPVTVSAGGLPVAAARVALFKDGEVAVSAYTDAAGEAVLALPAGLSAGELLVTVTGHNLIAHQGSVTLGATNVFAALVDHSLDDDLAGASLGNGDGQLNPGERVELALLLRNLGSAAAPAVSATLSSADPYVELVVAERDFGDLPPGGSAWSAGSYLIALSPAAPDGHVAELVLTAHSGLQSSTSLLRLPVTSGALVFEDFGWSVGGQLDPGESGDLTVLLRNAGSAMATDITATLVSHSPWVVVEDGDGQWPALFLGATGANDGDPFVLSVAPETFPGHLASFSLLLSYNERAVGEVEFQLPVGSSELGAPTGPDGYGYYAFEASDTDHPQSPSYEWIEIAPNHGGAGVDVGLSDFGSEQDDTRTLDLPFSFRYRGRDYDRLSVCSNGWAALGETSLVLYRNFSLPCAGAPPALLAPFWDNLYQYGSDRVYSWHDAENHRFVVEWSRVRSSYNTAQETFELVLYDPAHHPTATGDGEIHFVYDQISNYDAVNGYATVGIQDADNGDGLLLSYWNQHPASANNPGAGRALRILPLDDALRPVAAAAPAEGFVTPIELGTQLQRWLQLGNTGDAGSILYYALDTAALPDWLTVAQPRGSVPAGETAGLRLDFDATGLALGRHETALAINHSGAGNLILPVVLEVLADATEAAPAPTVLTLAQNHPNPFNPSTEIRFGLPAAARVELAIYDLAGREVARLIDGERLEAGEHLRRWQGRDAAGRALSSGVYLYRLEAGERRLVRKLTLLK